MGGSRRWIWIVLGGAVLVFAGFLLGAVLTDSTPSPSTNATTKQLEQAKLRQEVRQLQLNNDRSSGTLGKFLAVGPLITVLVGIGTLGAALIKQSNDLRAARESADTQAAQWREQFSEQQRADAEKADQWRSEFKRSQEESLAERDRERLQRFDQRLTEVVTNIGSANPALRLNAAAALGFFVKPDYSGVHCDLLNVIIANLKAKPDPGVADLLRRHLATLLNLLFDPAHDLDPALGSELDLTGTDLYRIDLHGLDLRDAVVADVAFAKLRLANLRETKLVGLRGLEAVLDGTHFSRADLEQARLNKATAVNDPVHFHGTRLVSATLEEAQLPGAEFQEALLQSAHLEGAKLVGADFRKANLADARFNDAELDEAALRSIALGALKWRQAFFDEAVRARLEELSKAGSAGPGADGT